MYDVRERHDAIFNAATRASASGQLGIAAISVLDSISSIEAFNSPPDSVGSARAFSRIGYDLDDALADLIDNSIDAQASFVEITFFRTNQSIARVAIADNGVGMSTATLRNAMQFGCLSTHASTDLGTFGLGMKSASLSQCKSMTVVSLRDGETSACRWTIEAIQDNWKCEVLDPVAAALAFKSTFAKNKMPKSGTVVFWDRLDRMATAPGEGELDEFLSRIVAKLAAKLGLVFHRFLERGNFSITLQSRNESRRLVIPRPVVALNPFAYEVTGKAGYPKVFSASFPGVGAIQLTAHIWPVGFATEQYLLGRRSGSLHQGLYFYRNDRLIQAGGWHDVISTPETALALARVAIDLPANATDINVQKSQIQLSAALSGAIRLARSGKIGFLDYLEDARKVLLAAKRRQRPNAKAPFVVGRGIGVPLRKKIRGIIAKKGAVREISFSWKKMSFDTFFALDRDDDSILLNARFRRLILGQGTASGADAPILKLLLFLLLRQEFDQERLSSQRRESIDRYNAILLESIKSM